MPNSCIFLPHGFYSILPPLLTTLGWMAALFEDTCNYAIVSGDIVSTISGLKVPYLEVGLQAYREPTFNVATGQWESVHNEDCITYPDKLVDMDTPWLLAKGFTFVALVLGGGATFYLWISTCCRFSRGSWRWAGYEVGGACFFQILSFIWFQTGMCVENNCLLFYGSKADIAAAVLWMMATLLIFGHYPTPKDYSEGDGIMHNDSASSVSENSDVSPSNQQRRRPMREAGEDGHKARSAKVPKHRPPDVEMAAGEDSQQESRPMQKRSSEDRRLIRESR